MVAELKVKSGDEDAYQRIREKLENPEGLLKQIGAYFVEQAQDAFRLSRLGPWEWPQQYPSQEDPFVHIAGVVSDLAGGEGIKARRFQRSPPLKDRGQLWQSIADERAIETPEKYLVTVGTDVEYAGVHQFGGVSRQPVTEPVKEGIREFIESEEGRKFWFKLAWLTGDIDELETQVNPRPFLGITPEAERDLPRITEEWLTAA